MNATRSLALVAALCGFALLLFWFLQRGDGGPPRALEDVGAAPPTPAAPQIPGRLAAPEPGGARPAAPAAERGVADLATEPEARQAVAPPAAEAPDAPRWTGRVVDERGLALRDAEVSVGSPPSMGVMAVQALPRRVDATGTTGGDGRFSLERARPREEPWVEVRARGYRLFGARLEVEPGPGDRELGVLVLERGAVIAGQVVDAAGQPVAGATVEREEETGGMAGLIAAAVERQAVSVVDTRPRTDAEGRFELANEDPGPFRLLVAHELYPDARVEGEVEAGETCSVQVEFPPSASIAGRIVGFPTGDEGVTLIARLVEPEPGSGSERTDFAELLGAEPAGRFGREAEVAPDGSFTVGGLLADRRYRVSGTRSLGMMQFERCTERLEVQAGDQQIELAYDPGASVVFRLVDAGTGAAVTELDLRHAWLGVDRRRGMTAGRRSEPRVAADGTVTLEELRPPQDPGRLRLVLRAPGYLEHELEEVVVPEGQRVDLGTIALTAAGSVRVRVLDAHTGEPVANARVRLAEDRLDFLSAALQAQRGGEDERQEFDEDAFDLLRPPRVEKGRTDGAGLCELPGFAALEALLEVEASSYAPFRRRGLVLRADGVQTELVELRRGATVFVRVVDVFDRPAPGVQVEHGEVGADASSATSTKKTNAKGLARFTRLSHGTHAFRIAPATDDALGDVLRQALGEEQQEEEWCEVTLGDGAEQELVLRLPARGRLEGRVTAAGQVVEGATVTLHPVREDDGEAAALRELTGQLLGASRSSRWSDRTDAEGRYAIADVPAGPFELHVAHPDQPLAHRFEVALEEGRNARDVALPSTTVVGRVTGPGGQPVVGAALEVLRADELDPELLEVRAFFRGTGLGAGGGGAPVMSGPGGEYTLHDLPVEVELVLHATHEDHAAARSAPFTLAPDALRSGVDVALGPAGRILVWAPDSEGPVAFVTAQPVRAEGDSEDGGPGGRAQTAVLRQGRAVLRGLRPGRWKVVVVGTGGASREERQVEVRAGLESQVTFAD